MTNLPPVKAFDGNSVTPKKILMREQDAKMLIMNDYNDKKVYYLDVEKGKVISEYYSDGINTFSEIAHANKNDEFTTNPVFLGMNERNIFLLDPREKGEEKMKKSKIYTKSNQFSCITPGVEGSFAIGSKTGEIRLFKEVGQNAKNLFAGNGDPIYSIDSTRDGKWLLATCKNYLILLPTFIAESNTNGFTHALGKDKPFPENTKNNPSRYGNSWNFSSFIYWCKI